MGQELEAAALGQRIFMVRGLKVMLARDLAELYRVPTYALNQAVKRNIKRFPSDFMLRLSLEEARSLTSQNVMLKRGEHIKHPPFAFTEQGVAMLSSVLRSDRAIEVNIAIMRAFVRLRDTLSLHKELAAQLRELERKVVGHDARIAEIFAVIKRLMETPMKPPPRIGFKPGGERKAPAGRRGG